MIFFKESQIISYRENHKQGGFFQMKVVSSWLVQIYSD